MEVPIGKRGPHQNGHLNYPVQILFFGIFIDKSPKNTIPKGENITEITISPRTFKMMVELVHIGCNQDQSQTFSNHKGRAILA